jgi:hypothetical protein
MVDEHAQALTKLRAARAELAFLVAHQADTDWLMQAQRITPARIAAVQQVVDGLTGALRRRDAQQLWLGEDRECPE